METLNKLTYQAGVTTHEDVLNNINSNADAANENFDALEKNKQDNLTFDNTPTDGSDNPVTSGGVKSYVDKNISSTNDSLLQSDIKNLVESADDYPNDYTVNGGSVASSAVIGDIEFSDNQYVYFKILRKEGTNINSYFYAGTYSKKLEFDENNIAEGYIIVAKGGNLRVQLYQSANSDKGVYSILSFKYKYVTYSLSELKKDFDTYKDSNDGVISEINNNIMSDITSEVKSQLGGSNIFNKESSSTIFQLILNNIKNINSDCKFEFTTLDGNDNSKAIQVYIQTLSGSNIINKSVSEPADGTRTLIFTKEELAHVDEFKAALYLPRGGTFNFEIKCYYGSFKTDIEKLNDDFGSYKTQTDETISEIIKESISDKTYEIKKVLTDAIFNNTTTQITTPNLFGLIDVVGGDMYINFKLLNGNDNSKSITVYLQQESGTNIKSYISKSISENERQIVIPEADFSSYDKIKAVLYLQAGTYNFSCTLKYGNIQNTLNEVVENNNKIIENVSIVADSDMYESRNPLYYYNHIITISADENDEEADFKGAQSIWNALESIQDASAINRYCIYVKPGLYEIKKKSDFHPFAGGYFTYFESKDYVDIIGTDPRACIFAASIKDEDYNAESYQTFYSNGKSNLKNLSIISYDLRYAVHRDGGSNFLRAENCIVKSYNGKNKTTLGDAWGTGTHNGEITEIIGGESFTDRKRAIAIHTNSEFDYPSGYRIKNHRMITTYEDNRGVLNMQELGSGVCNFVDMQGCGFGTNRIITWYAGLYNTERNPLGSKGCIVNCANFRLYGCGNDKFLFKTDGGVFGLKIESLSRNINSKVEFKECTASGLVYSHYPNKNTIIPDEEYDDRGYIYKLGANGISAYAIGMTPSDFWGEVLGDCTTDNKTLIISIDGTDYSIIFNEDYTTMQDVKNKVVESINQVINSVATASAYCYAQDYYAECSDVMGVYYNNSSEDDNYILKGRAVSLNGTGIEKCDGSKELLGIAIDDFCPSHKYAIGAETILKGFGRVVKNAYLPLSNVNPTPTGSAYCVTPLQNINSGDNIKINNNGEIEKDENGKYKVIMINSAKCIEI